MKSNETVKTEFMLAPEDINITITITIIIIIIIQIVMAGGFSATELPSTVILLEKGTRCAVQAETNTKTRDNTHWSTFGSKNTS